MDTTSSLQIPGAQLDRIERGDDTVILHFSLVHLVQVMEGAFQDSLWKQAGDLVIRNVEINGELPQCPCELLGGDMINNIYTYRDHAPLPIDWNGSIGCKFTVAGSGAVFTIDGTAMQMEMIDHPRYISHIDKT
jgi:hypothetical protein